MTSSQATMNATLHHCPLWEIMLCCRRTLTLLIKQEHVAMRQLVPNVNGQTVFTEYFLLIMNTSHLACVFLSIGV